MFVYTIQEQVEFQVGGRSFVKKLEGFLCVNKGQGYLNGRYLAGLTGAEGLHVVLDLHLGIARRALEGI